MSEAADTPWGRLLVHRQTLGFDHPMSDDLLAASQRIRQLELELDGERSRHRSEVERLTNRRTLAIDELQALIARLVGIDDLCGLSSIDIHMTHDAAIRVTTTTHTTSADTDAHDDAAATAVAEVFRLVPTGEIMEWSNA